LGQRTTIKERNYDSVADFCRGGCKKRVGVRDWAARGEEGNLTWRGRVQVFSQHSPFPVECGGVIYNEWWYLCRECATLEGWKW